MSGFAFPPPPPPPPKATSADDVASAQPEVYGQRRGRGGGGDRGRGRGRGRGGNNRGGYGNHGGRGQFEGGARNSATGPVPGVSLPPQNPYGQVLQPQQPSHYPAFPTGGYINPAFTPLNAVSQQQWSSPMYAASLNPNLYPQQSWLQSLMQNQTNGAAQSQSIDAGNATNTNGTSSKNTVQLPSNTQPQRNDTPRNSRGRNAALAGAHPRQKPTAVPKVQAAPAVPSFGFSLPTVKPEVPIAAGASDQAQGTKKRKFNQLGLTPRSEVLVESEEEEVDEEQKFANVGGVLQFEYKGRSSTLKSPEEIAAWIEERKKRFPTKARIEEKAKLDAEKKVARQQMADRVTAEKKAHEKSVSDKRKKQKTQPEANDDDRRRKTMEKHLRKAEKLRKQLQQEEEKAARAARAANPVGQGQSTKAKLLEAGSKPSLGLAYDSEDSHDEDDESEDDASSVVSSSSEDISSDSDETSDDSDDSDAPPDEETSVKRPIKVAPPARKPREGPQPKPARKERQKDQPQKRQTLRDRWVEQEKREEAKQALQAIKFLGESGFLG